MKAILKKYNLVEKLLLLSFLTLVSKPILGQFLQSDNNINICNSAFDFKKLNSSALLKVSPFDGIEKIESIEELEELVEDEDDLIIKCSSNAYLFSPSTATLDRIVITSYIFSILKSLSKPKFYIAYSCLRSYLI